MGNDKEKTRKGILCIAAGCMIFAAVFLRTYRIATIPYGMHIDEAGLGLNAWSIANFGTDRYGNYLPVLPSNFYSEQSAFYTYFCALLVKFFGLNLYTLRMPGVFMGVLTVIFGALLMRERWGTKGFFVGLLLLGIFPYFIMNCRFALDCNVMLGMLTISLYYFVRLLKKVQEDPDQRRYGNFALLGILFGITLYTYIIAAIAIAVFGVLFGVYYLFYRKENRFLRMKQLLFLAVPLGIMAIPLILVFCVNYFDLEPIVTPFFSVPKMLVNRTEEVELSLAGLKGKLRNLLYPLTSDGKFGSSDRYWTMYRCSVIFVAVGGIHSIYRSVRDLMEKRLSIDLVMLFVTFGEVVLFLLCGYYNYHINGIFIALAYFCVGGVLFFWGLCKKHWTKAVCIAALILFYGLSFAGFVKEYFASEEVPAFQVYNGVSGALSLLEDKQKEKEIYILDEVGEFYFLSNPIAPSEFLSFSNELGYIVDYQNLHFYAPSEFHGDEVVICNKGSGWYVMFFESQMDAAYLVMETDCYCVFYNE
ncbi:MAG: glycosyltransferase family 39 protein [Candidatus Gastranaerophilales bacterium]|nr:glycosyltransferase family 39 protein [Candidatus Gastranaerophilales bacterium]